MKKFLRPLSRAWISVVTHKLRSTLTILGVVIGIAAVIILMSIGAGVQSSIMSSLGDLGSNTINITPGASSFGGLRGASGTASTLTLEDAQAIAENVENIDGVAPSGNANMQVIAGSQNMAVRITGITPGYQEVSNVVVASGDYITEYEYDRNSKVAILGPTVSETLFEGADPVGETIRMGGNVFTVIGILESKGQSFTSTDSAILIPLSTMQGMTSSLTTTGQHSVNAISVHVTDEAHIVTVKENITALLRDRHNIALGADDDFSAMSTDELTNTISSVTQTMTLMLGAIAGISLLVGGIGVMNIMLVSVMERRKEIGIRKALGAMERQIWGQFLLDSAVLTFAGGIIGVALGWGGSYLVNASGFIQTVVAPQIVVLAVAVSIGIGLFFGFYPAWQGSRLDPIQALRSE